MFVAPLLAKGIEDGLSAEQPDLLPKHQLNTKCCTFLRCGVSPSRASSILFLKSLEGVIASYSHFFL